MHKRIADALLIHTGCALSAVISIGEENRVLFVSLFDTCWQAEHMYIAPEAACVDLISHHPQGQWAPYDEDIENLKRLRRLCAGRPVRLFVASEYFSCREIAL